MVAPHRRHWGPRRSACNLKGAKKGRAGVGAWPGDTHGRVALSPSGQIRVTALPSLTAAHPCWVRQPGAPPCAWGRYQSLPTI